jgi:DNA-binding PadR family transcriptional regulator
LIQSRREASKGRGPGRKVYRLTPAGQAAWREAAIAALANPERAYSAFQLGLANLPAIPVSEAIEALQNYGERLRSRLDHVQKRKEQSGEDLPLHAAAMFDLSMTLIEAELSWVQQFVRELSASTPTRSTNDKD